MCRAIFVSGLSASGSRWPLLGTASGGWETNLKVDFPGADVDVFTSHLHGVQSSERDKSPWGGIDKLARKLSERLKHQEDPTQVRQKQPSGSWNACVCSYSLTHTHLESAGILLSRTWRLCCVEGTASLFHLTAPRSGLAFCCKTGVCAHPTNLFSSCLAFSQALGFLQNGSSSDVALHGRTAAIVFFGTPLNTSKQKDFRWAIRACATVELEMKSKATKPDKHEIHNLANVLRGLDSTKTTVVSIHEGQTSQFTGKSIMRLSCRSKIVWRHLPSLPSFLVRLRWT